MLTNRFDSIYATIVDMEFKDWLLLEIKRKHRSPAEFARRSGLSKQTIYNYLDGRLPETDGIARLAIALKKSPEEIIRAMYSQKSHDDSWIEQMVYRIGLLNETNRNVAERVLNALLEEQEKEPDSPEKGKAKI